MTLNANGDAVTCCILQDHPTAVLGSIHAVEPRRRSGTARPTSASARELREIMARRGAVGDFSHSCAVESVCAREGRVPDAVVLLGRRRRRSAASFHEIGRGDAGPAGAPFATLPGGDPARL